MLLVLATAPREQALGLLGGMACGAVPSIVSFPSGKQSRQRFLSMLAGVVHHSGARWILCDGELREALDWEGLEERQARVLAFPDLAALDVADLPTPSPRPDPWPAEDRPLFLQFSSGTTGARKGVLVTAGMFVRHTASYAEALGLSPADRVVSWLPLYHDNGLVGCFLQPLYVGAFSLHLDPFEWLEEPVLVFQAVARHRGTLLWSPNFAFSFCARRVTPAELAGLDLGSLRAFLSGGELVRVRSRQEFLARFAGTGIEERHLAVCYGMAENTFVATQTAIGRVPRIDTVERDVFLRDRRAVPVAPEEREAPGTLTFVSCGPPIPRHEVRIGGAAAERQVGEIEIKSDCLFAGYVTAGSLVTDSLTPEGWYKSGDLGYLADGELYVTGRAKDLIIHRGVNLHPDDLEEETGAVAGAKPGRTVVFGLRDGVEGTEQIVALLEPEGPEVDRAELARRVREAVTASFGVNLADVRVCAPGTLLKSTSGKISRNANREAYVQELTESGGRRASGPSGERQRQAPRDVWERELVDIWQEALGVRSIGIEENLFLDLGAGSLATLAAAGEVRARLGREVAAHELLADETIARQAERLRHGAGTAEAGRALVALRRDGGRLPLFLVHPSGGDPWSYLALARRLGPEQPVYAFQDPHRNADEGGFGSLEEMAAAYVAELTAFHPGPYALGGWSLGGAIAYEMASQLAVAGREVATVILLDTFKPGSPLQLAWFRLSQAVARRVLRAFGMRRLFRLLQGGQLPSMRRLEAMAFLDYGWCDRRRVAASFPGLVEPGELAHLPAEEVWEHLFRRIHEQAGVSLLPGRSARERRRENRISAIHQELGLAYAPREVFPGSLTHFVQRGSRSPAAWARHAARPPTIHEFDIRGTARVGDPHLAVMQEENVELFAGTLASHLEAVSAATRLPD